MAHLKHVWLASGAALGLAFAGCASDPAPSESADSHLPNSATDFVSDLNPEDLASAAGRESELSGAVADAAQPSANAAPPNDDAAAAERAITEADIIHLDGDTLYALSEYSGLTIVDIADPAALRITGRHMTAGTPFEMYVSDGVATVMLNAWSHYVYDEAEQQTAWVETSVVQALDVSDGSHIQKLSEFDVPGSISDSRRVGDVLYLVTTEYGCWGCSTGPSTVVTSFDLVDLDHVQQVDQLRFEEPAETYIGQRSISVTPERIYIGGYDWNYAAEGEGSSIQLVDISEPGGDLTAGAEIRIAGQISSRLQMDEYEGTLRVLSQWDTWRADSPPTLETYRIDSASQVTKLAALPVQLPRPELLQSVRFTG